MEKGLYKIHSDPVQLSLCRSSLWNDDAAGRLSLVSFIVCQCGHLYRGFSVCVNNLFKQQCFYVDHRSDCFLYGGKKWTIVKKVFCTFSVRRFSLR